MSLRATDDQEHQSREDIFNRVCQCIPPETGGDGQCILLKLQGLNGLNKRVGPGAKPAHELRVHTVGTHGKTCTYSTKQRERHVTRSFCCPCRLSPAFPFGQFKEPPFRFNFAHLPLPFKFQRNVDDQPRGPTAISPFQVGPSTVASSPRTCTPHPRSRSATRSCPLTVHTTVYNNILRVAKPTLNSTTRAPTSSPPTSAPHIVSTEHDRDSQDRKLTKNLLMQLGRCSSTHCNNCA